MITVAIGEYNVESSGSLITFENKPIKISIDDMNFELVFKEDSSNSMSSKNSVINDSLMKIELFNFLGQLSFKDNPDAILEGNNKTYYLDLIISNLEKKRMLVHYMILSKPLQAV